MLCESCNTNVATVHLTEITNKGKKDLHLCESCAQEKGVAFKATHFSISDLLGGLVESPPPEEKDKEKEKSPKAHRELVCKNCGLTFSEFKAAGRLGCAECYTAFSKGLVPLLNKIHQSDRHAGKVPRRVAQRVTVHQEVADLRRRLDEAVKTEEYEKAATLRDQIQKLEARGPADKVPAEKGRADQGKANA